MASFQTFHHYLSHETYKHHTSNATCSESKLKNPPGQNNHLGQKQTTCWLNMILYQSSYWGMSPLAVPVLSCTLYCLDKYCIYIIGCMHFEQWLSSDLCAVLHREVKLKCRLPDSLARILISVKPCIVNILKWNKVPAWKLNSIDTIISEFNISFILYE